MSTSTSSPKLFIGNKEIISFTKVNYTDNGKNQVSNLDVTLTDPELRRASLHNKEITFFLNYGSTDTVPFFRGRIRQVSPTDTALNLSAFDVRTYLTSKESLVLSFTDNDNYDGFTLSQFLRDYITEFININETIIGLDLLNETNPVVSLSGFREENTNVLEVIKKKLPNNSNDLSDIKRNLLTVIDDGVKSNVCFVTEQSIDDVGVAFTYSDGIEKLSVKKRKSPNLLSTKVGDTNVLYKHNNLQTGVVAGAIEGDFESPDEARKSALIQSTLAEKDFEITLTASKGHYLNIGNVIQLVTPDFPEITGKHRIVSKNISCTNTGTTCQLQLAKERPQLSEYL